MKVKTIIDKAYVEGNLGKYTLFEINEIADMYYHMEIFGTYSLTISEKVMRAFAADKGYDISEDRVGWKISKKM